MRLIFIVLIIIGAYSYYYDRDPFWISYYTSGAASVENAKWISAPSIKDADRQPIQKNLSGAERRKYSRGYVTLKAEYQLTAKVLSKKEYTQGIYGRVAPVDLALGWGRMSYPSVVSRLSISQRDRFYYWRSGSAPPLPPSEISTNSANVHILPATQGIKNEIMKIGRGQIVSLKGYLVNYKEGNARSWWTVESSLTRKDTGDGACEVFYVEKVQIH